MGNQNNMPLTTPTKEPTAQDFHDAIPYEKYATWHEDVVAIFEKMLSQVRQQSFSAGRLQGLKEMDESWEGWYHGSHIPSYINDFHVSDPEDEVGKLRSEYQKPN